LNNRCFLTINYGFALNFWRFVLNRQVLDARERKKVGAPLPAGLGASLACSGWVLANLERARLSGALFVAHFRDKYKFGP